MPRRDSNPNFVEAVARGLDLIRAFEPGRPSMTLAELATAASLPRPTASRILYTLETLGYVRSVSGGYTLTVRILELGMTYVQQVDMWDVARPRLQELVAQTGESSSIAELDGSDIVYVARVAVPKLIALVVRIGTKFPAAPTSLGKVLLAGLSDDEVARVMAEPSRSGIEARWKPDLPELIDSLSEVRAQGWSLTDEQLASGIRSIAAPLRDGSGQVRAAMNVTVHAAETSKEVLLGEHLPKLLATASALSADWARRDAIPYAEQS
ncbi:IclR family transcriptional regulator domain-containing protein [Phytoactinopolyspora endophytica]|uniref:IclR family transcriptional regulator domain-containing protein n=1 Tax=Phytoactinopolyspora endophytica TaxID=1642495 RepID=UPI00101BAAD8|nr:IclR family transcriptional regulator C-terminal domain-containing protein [Phytoactinopolyspora endophytica]